MATIHEKLGDNIRKYRKGMKLSQEQLAARAHISPRSVIEIESGNRDIKLRTLWRIVKALQINSSSILPF